MNFILFDSEVRENLLPFTFTKPVAEIRVGILTITEKWEKHLGEKIFFKTQDYLSRKYSTGYISDHENVWINGAVCPDAGLVNEIKKLGKDTSLFYNNILIAYNSGNAREVNLTVDGRFGASIKKTEASSKPFIIENVWDIFSKNGEAIEADFDLITKGKISHSISRTNTVIKPTRIFVEEGAKIECAILNASCGPIYIGKDAEIMEGSIVRGPFALCEHSTLKMGAKIYGPTTIGPHSKVGGEVNNSVIFGCSNKAHDGFLGNSVIGEWCNLGADTNNSNLKNNYGTVNLWNHAQGKQVDTGLTFCGLFMGDHSKCGINTMFNTGTVVGVNANIFGAGFPPTIIPSFSWGGAHGFATYKLNEAFETATRVFERRSKRFDETEKEILSKVFELTENQRK